MTDSPWLSRGLALACGLACALAFPPFGLLPGLLGYALLLRLTDTTGPRPLRSAFFRGWLAGVGYFAVSVWWITEAFLVDAQAHGWMAPFALLFMAAGLALFWGAEGNYWGHNAILRVRAFADHCGLPRLPGPRPFGGDIMSHDFVEAALLRRAGWQVRLAPRLEGTYEECPPTLPDMAVRDRRWAQGNIQHLALLGSTGFHWVSRLQLLIGATAFVTSPLWLLLIVTTIAQALLGGDASIVRGTSFQILEMTLVLLFAPKFMSGLWACVSARRRVEFGGAGAIWKSIAPDIPLSMLMAPATMLTQTIALVNIFLGRRSGWQPQSRERDGLAMADVLPRYRWHLALGVVLLVLTPFAVSTAVMLTPITLGLIAAPWLAQWTASAKRGGALAARGYFTVPPERIP